VAQNPDPSVELTSSKGVTRTLDDWATVFHLAVVILPPRPEASEWVPVIDRIYHVLGDSDTRTTVCVNGEPSIAKRILGDAATRWLTFCDPDGRLAAALGLEMLPAFVHLRQDTSLVDAAEGWSPSAWQRVADGLAKASRWSSPQVAHRSNPTPTAGWAV
jgi:hypothetical protein